MIQISSFLAFKWHFRIQRTYWTNLVVDPIEMIVSVRPSVYYSIITRFAKNGQNLRQNFAEKPSH